MAQLSAALESARERLRRLLHPEDEWTPVVIEVRDTDRLLASPLGQLVVALGDTPDTVLQTRRWGRLCLSVARRLQACWEYQCDTDPFSPRLEAVSKQLFLGIAPDERLGLEHCPEPSYRGKELPDDCCVTCPNLAALALTWCVSFAREPCANYVIDCVREADRAFSESPIGRLDQFRKWVLDFAVPAAWEDRDLTTLEAGALRGYNIALVRQWREDNADPGDGVT
jgi:hypothetical protein